MSATAELEAQTIQTPMLLARGFTIVVANSFVNPLQTARNSKDPQVASLAGTRPELNRQSLIATP
jgi:hypothetical protein